MARAQGTVAKELMDEDKPVASCVDERVTWPKTVASEEQAKVSMRTVTRAMARKLTVSRKSLNALEGRRELRGVVAPVSVGGSSGSGAPDLVPQRTDRMCVLAFFGPQKNAPYP